MFKIIFAKYFLLMLWGHLSWTSFQIISDDICRKKPSVNKIVCHKNFVSSFKYAFLKVLWTMFPTKCAHFLNFGSFMGP